MSGWPKLELVLSESEFEQPKALTMRHKTAQAWALQARILLSCAQGMDNKTVAVKLRLTRQTVANWRARFVADRVDGLLDAPPPTHPRQSTTRMSTWLSRRRSSPCLPGRRTGAHARWPRR
ncbi:hypothetical protein OKW46_006540 [Paraburkholderia sp. WSM4179]|nr:hypothetical protein [Paraburkholderia sp. WSM4179]